ncbi:MAG: hypothetical protein KDK97_03075 [Verrucomicrobiales bacterium]|nr:hypothetical protein [Verrucomicrobiales bacterium]MCP5557296.1 hypothetical protein [Verrucomicrobiaceae bacterium]
MSKYQEAHIRNVSEFATYGMISPAPQRGYIVMAIANDDKGFTVESYDIVGVVVRSLPRSCDTGSPTSVVPLYINPCYAHEVSGGLFILEHDDLENLYYSVVWCHWPEREDHSKLESIRAHVFKEAELELKRRKKK